jgi:Tyrosine phosphatase family
VRSRPFDRSFWVSPERLLGGGYPGDSDPRQEQAKLQALFDAGIRAFVDLTHPTDCDPHDRPLAPYTTALASIAGARGVVASYARCPMVDETAPTSEAMKTTLDIIDARLRARETVYVHCWGGRGRTGTVAGCWLARHGVARGEEVLAVLRRARYRRGALDLPCPAEKSQRDMVVRWRVGE